MANKNGVTGEVHYRKEQEQMTVEEWHDSAIGGRVVEALKKNGFEAVYYCPPGGCGAICP